MRTESLVLFIALVLSNIGVFILFVVDKSRAKKKKRRISERTLLLSAFLFGGLGAFLAMNLFRHKTQKKDFILLVTIFEILHIIIMILALQGKII